MAIVAFLAGLILFIMAIINLFKKKPTKKLWIAWLICSVVFVVLLGNETETEIVKDHTKDTKEVASSGKLGNDKKEEDKDEEAIKAEEEQKAKAEAERKANEYCGQFEPPVRCFEPLNAND